MELQRFCKTAQNILKGNNTLSLKIFLNLISLETPKLVILESATSTLKIYDGMQRLESFRFFATTVPLAPHDKHSSSLTELKAKC